MHATDQLALPGLPPAAPRGQLRLHLPEPEMVPAEVDALVDALAALRAGDALNVYDEAACTALGDPPGQATARRERLRRYLAARWDAPVVCCGEAHGYQGARFSGVPFTSQRQLTGAGPAEPSATIVHKALARFDAEESVILWNAVMAHPWARERGPLSNRPPTRAERDAFADVLAAVTAGRRVVAIGKVAAAATGAPAIRHPANGGATAFTEGLGEQLAALGIGAGG